MYLFILGRQPEIGLAELIAVYGNAELILPQIAIVKTENQPDINRLGGTRKIGHIIYNDNDKPEDFLIKKLTALPAGKITLGVSQYGKSTSKQNSQRIARFIKSRLNRSVRVLPNQSAEISDAATLGNKLGTSPNKIEFLMIYSNNRVIVAELIGVQNLNSYTFRDRSRPRRDARVGMLPPKLAQIMLNLAQPNTGSLILDPFCGTGVVLQEALLQGHRVYGTDINPCMIDYTKENLDWLQSKKLFWDSHTKALENLNAADSSRAEIIEPKKRRKGDNETPSGGCLSTAPHNFQRNEEGKAQSGFFERTLTKIGEIKLEVADATNYIWSPKPDAIVCETYLGQPYTSPPDMQTLNKNIQTCNTIIKNFLANLQNQITLDTKICLAVPAWSLYKKFIHLPIIDQLTKIGYKKLNNPLIYHRDDQFVARELLVLQKLK